jgi:hypothetical protein
LRQINRARAKRYPERVADAAVTIKKKRERHGLSR